MPSNIRQLKRDIQKAITGKKGGRDFLGDIRQVITKTLLRYLALYTPVLTGRLAGGWDVVIEEKGTGDDAFNKSRRPSKSNIDAANKIRANDEVKVRNEVYYLVYLIYGTRYMAPRGFVQQALLSTQLELAARGIKVQWSS